MDCFMLACQGCRWCAMILISFIITWGIAYSTAIYWAWCLGVANTNPKGAWPGPSSRSKGNNALLPLLFLLFVSSFQSQSQHCPLPAISEGSRTSRLNGLFRVDQINLVLYLSTRGLEELYFYRKCLISVVGVIISELLNRFHTLGHWFDSSGLLYNTTGIISWSWAGRASQAKSSYYLLRQTIWFGNMPGGKGMIISVYIKLLQSQPELCVYCIIMWWTKSSHSRLQTRQLCQLNALISKKVGYLTNG